MLRYLYLLIGALAIVGLDQLSKLKVSAALVENGTLPANAHHIRSAVHPVFESGFNLRVTGNKGAAWGLLRDLPETWRVPFFVTIAAVAVIAILIFYKNAHGQKVLSVALVSILGGALGNLVDRVRLGYVVDFIDWYHGDWHFPTFNVADIAISVGVGLLLVDMVLHRGEPPDERGA